MREPACCAIVGNRLARHGVPAARIDRVMRELADHWEDLHAAALKEGLPAVEAAAQADLRLGHPEKLAARIIAGFKRNSWLGRHSILGLCVVPLLLAPALMGVIMLPFGLMDEFFHFSSWSHPAGRLDPRLLVDGLWGLDYAAMIASVVWLCRRGWMQGLGIRWVLGMCSWCALTSLSRFFDVNLIWRHVVFGLGFPFKLNTNTTVILVLHGLTAACFILAAWKARKKLVAPA